MTQTSNPTFLTLAAVATALALQMTSAAGADTQDVLAPTKLLDRLPAGALEVADAMKTAKAGQEIVVRGRITNGNDVFNPSRAVFKLADESAVPACCQSGQHTAENQGDCTVAAENRATVQFVDQRGQPLPYGLKNKHGLKVGKEVFIVGKVHEADNEKALIINAASMHVPQGDVPFGLMLSEAPQDALDVIDAKKVAQPGETITVRGRVGGMMRPFIDGRALFTIVGKGPLACSDVDDDHCSTPWDYCCTPRQELLASSATIQLVDERGAPIRTDIKGRRGIRELSDVSIVGTVISAQRGTLIVKASGIYVNK